MKNRAYPITTLCREDLKQRFRKKDIAKLTDADIEHIAGKIGQQCLDCCYWDAMEVAADEILRERD